MTRLEILFLAVVVALGGVAFAFIDDSEPAQVELPAAQATLEQTVSAPAIRDVLQEQVEMGRTHRDSVATTAKAVVLNAKSEALLQKFDEISELLEATTTDCDALAYGLSTMRLVRL